MKRNKESYMNFVCPRCWNTLNNCTCELFPPYYIIFIDKNIQEHIKTLNEKGYITTGCCEGHMDICTSTYIAFADKYNFKGVGIPSGFKYNDRKKMVYYDYSTKLTKEKIEELKREKLKILLEWCKNLPNRA